MLGWGHIQSPPTTASAFRGSAKPLSVLRPLPFVRPISFDNGVKAPSPAQNGPKGQGYIPTATPAVETSGAH